MSFSLSANSTVTIVGSGEKRGFRASSVLIAGINDTKIDSTNDSYSDKWIIRTNKQVQIHQLTRYGISESTFYFSHGTRLVKVRVDGQGKFSKIYLIDNPTMRIAKIAAEQPDIPICRNLNAGPFEGITDVAPALDKLNTISSRNSCSELNPNSRKKIATIVATLTQSHSQDCYSKELKRVVNYGEGVDLALTSLKNAVIDGVNLGENGIFECHSHEEMREAGASTTTPDRIRLRRVGSSLDTDTDFDTVSHEFVHMALRIACLTEGKSSCEEISTDEATVTSVTQSVVQCTKKYHSADASVGAALVANTSNPQYLAETIGSPEGAPIATLQLSEAQGQPVTPAQINELAYMPAAETLGKEKPGVLEEKTRQLAQPMIDKGERIFKEVRRAIGSDLDFLPSAGAETGRMRLSKAATDTSADAVQKFERNVSDISGGERTKPKVVPYARGDLSSDRVATATGSDQVKLTRDVNVSETANNSVARTGASQKERVLEGTAAAPGALNAAGGSGGGSGSAGGGSGGGGGSGRGVRQAGKQDKPENRSPAAIDKKLNPEVVKTQVKSLRGGELISKLENDSDFLTNIAGAKIAVFDINNKVHGASPDDVDVNKRATACFLVRSLDRGPTTINCQVRRKR